MKRINKIMKLIALMIVIFFTTNLKAQHTEMMEKRKEIAEKRFNDLSERLQLTLDQQTKLKAIAKENRLEMKQLHEGKKDAPKEERRAAMDTQLKKANAQISAILAPQQQELFIKYKAEMKKEREKKWKERNQEKEEMEDGKLF
jgi:hypothetical protein